MSATCQVVCQATVTRGGRDTHPSALVDPQVYKNVAELPGVQTRHVWRLRLLSTAEVYEMLFFHSRRYSRKVCLVNRNHLCMPWARDSALNTTDDTSLLKFSTSSLRSYPDAAGPAGGLCSDLVSVSRLRLNLQRQTRISNHSERGILLRIFKGDGRKFFLKVTQNDLIKKKYPD